MNIEKQIALTKPLMALFESTGMSRRHFLKMLGVAGGGTSLAALITACGGDDDDNTQGETAPTTVSDESTPGADGGSDVDATAEPQDESTGAVTPKVLVIGHGQDISNLDPHVASDYSIAPTQKAVYDTLLRFKGNPPQLVNLLATEHSGNDDATEWTFKLDDRAAFHDGTPVKASDVVYSAQRMIRKNRGLAWLLTNVMSEDGVEAIDDHTVKFTLDTPFSPFPMAMPWLFIANEKLVREHDVNGDEGEAWLLDHEAGSGPFTIKSWNVGDSYEFEAVADYWHGWPQEGRLAGYIWRIMRESSSRRLALLSGAIHTASLSVEDFSAMQGEPGFTFIEEEGFEVSSIKMNNQHGLTADVNIRKAISYAMDYEAIIDVFQGKAVLLHGPLPPNNPYANLEMEVYRHNIDKAREHLAMTDYPDGGFTLEYVYVTGVGWQEQIGLILLDQLRQLNITLTMTPKVWPDMAALISDAETTPDLIPVSIIPTYPHPNAYLWTMYHSTQAGTSGGGSHFSNTEYDRLVEEAQGISDEEQLRSLYNQAQQILVDNAVEIWEHSGLSQRVNSERLGGFEFNPIYGEYMVDYWLKDE